MRLLYVVAIGLLLAFASCEENASAPTLLGYDDLGTGLTQEQETDILAAMFQEIYTLATADSCQNGNDWKYTAIGSKACGGPQMYIPYSTNIDEASFLASVQQYTDAEAAYNVRWGVISTCDIPQEPIGVQCVNGVAELEY
jgi:hypothetical protein